MDDYRCPECGAKLVEMYSRDDAAIIDGQYCIECDYVDLFDEYDPYPWPSLYDMEHDNGL